MSKQKKRNRSGGQKQVYKIISHPTRSGRYGFKACALMAAAGLSLSAVITTMPETVASVMAVSHMDSQPTAIVREIPDMSAFYSDADLISVEIPSIVEEFASEEEKLKAEEAPGAFEGYATTLSQEDAQAKLLEAQVTSKHGYVRLNKHGIPMSEMEVPEWLELDENGVPKNYKYTIKGKSTAYHTGSITATGTRPQQGTVAVNPRQIPYGTEMWIVSLDGKYVYGYAKAEDTGGFVHFRNGATVDLYMYSGEDAANWGWRGAIIYILDSGK